MILFCFSINFIRIFRGKRTRLRFERAEKNEKVLFIFGFFFLFRGTRTKGVNTSTFRLVNKRSHTVRRAYARAPACPRELAGQRALLRFRIIPSFDSTAVARVKNHFSFSPLDNDYVDARAAEGRVVGYCDCYYFVFIYFSTPAAGKGSIAAPDPPRLEATARRVSPVHVLSIA